MSRYVKVSKLQQRWTKKYSGIKTKGIALSSCNFHTQYEFGLPTMSPVLIPLSYPVCGKMCDPFPYYGLSLLPGLYPASLRRSMPAPPSAKGGEGMVEGIPFLAWETLSMRVHYGTVTFKVIVCIHLFDFVVAGEQRRRVVCVRKEDSFIVSDIRCESSGYKKPPELIQKCNVHCSIRYLTFTFATEAAIVI